jgi:hypothetical protein
MDVILFLLICSIPALWIGSGIWAYGDAAVRQKPPLAVALLVMFAVWPLGLCAWLVFRPGANGPRHKPFNLHDYRKQ